MTKKTTPRKAKGQPGPGGAPRANRRPKRTFWVWAGVLTAVASLACGLLVFWAVGPGPGAGERVVLDLPSGLTRSELAQLLAKEGVVASPELFSLYLATLARGVRAQPGTHILNDGLSPRELAQRLGRLRMRPARKVTVVEGFTLFQIAERLETQEICAAKSFVAAAQEPSLLAQLTLRDSAEGYLFPATYEFKVDSEASKIVTLLVAEAKRRFAEAFRRESAGYQHLRENLGFEERDIVTLASMVEKEAGHADERPLIAGVFLNRLTDPSFLPRQFLQSDPTAAYGCKSLGDSIPSCLGFNGKVTPAMLRDRQNPYNTYAHAGLPPGPIANPSVAALTSVLAPAETDYLFFVAKGGGRHAFSRTYEEHRQAFSLNPKGSIGIPKAPPIPAGGATTSPSSEVPRAPDNARAEAP